MATLHGHIAGFHRVQLYLTLNTFTIFWPTRSQKIFKTLCSLVSSERLHILSTASRSWIFWRLYVVNLSPSEQCLPSVFMVTNTNRQQARTTYDMNVRMLASQCNFGVHLEETLCARFVCSLGTSPFSSVCYQRWTSHMQRQWR